MMTKLRSFLPWLVLILLACVGVLFSGSRQKLIAGSYTHRFPPAELPKGNPFINSTIYCNATEGNKPCVYFIDKKDTYVLGDTVYVGIVMNHRESKFFEEDKSDVLLVYAKNEKKGAASTAEVIYQGHGKYIAMLRAFWVGRSTVHVTIRATGSSIEKINTTLIHQSLGRDYFCKFEYSSHHESTSAYMVLKHNNNSKKYCNLTGENYGYPLYCLQPTNRVLQCTDWTKIYSKPTKSPLMTEIQRGAVMARVESNLMFDVISKTAKNLLTPSVVCEKKLFSETWSGRSPIGYFYNKKWHSSHCHGVTSQNISKLNSCLKDRTIRLFGDSTVRQLYLSLKDTLNASITTEKITEAGAGHRPSRGVATALNTTLYWGLHGIPLGYETMNRAVTRPIHANIDLVKPNSNDIIIFGIFAHFVSHHQRIFREHMRIIAKSVKALLARAPDVKVAIKGPHSISQQKASFDNFVGVVGYLFRKIIFEEFHHLREKVIFLDEMDLTISMENNGIHPHKEVVQALVDHFLLYTCTR